MKAINDLNILYLASTDLKCFIGLLVFALFSYWLIRKVYKINKELSQMLINGEKHINEMSKLNERKTFK